MSGVGEISESRARAKAREAERQRQRDERKLEANDRRSKNGDKDDPNDPLAEERRIWREKQRAKGEMDGMSNTVMSEEDQIITHAQRLQSENAATLKNTIKVARETTVVGAATIQKLGEQTEQFERMDHTLDQTNESLTRSERILRGMKGIGGAITNLFTSDKSKKSSSTPAKSGAVTAAASTISGLEEKDRDRQRRKESGDTSAGSSSSKGVEPWPNNSSSSSSSRSTADIVNLTGNRSMSGATPPGGIPPNSKQAAAIQVFEANQHQEDQALDELSDVLGTLKQQSQMMNTQLNQQAKILDRIDDKVDNTSARLKQGSRTMTKIS